MSIEYNPMEPVLDPALEQAMSEITDETIDSAVIEAAAARVWANVVAQAAEAAHVPLRTCEDFQAQIPDFKAGRLPEARAMLVKDHLHECVACRRVYEGRVVAMPLQAAPRKVNYTARWAVAAAVVAAAGLSVWVAVRPVRQPHGQRDRTDGERHALRNPAHRNHGAGGRADRCRTASKSAPPKIPTQCCN